ncbi:hypothetical protein TNCV_15251 [Trichonephila clavipes]|nr:hypothetical protein TNCV_15251 [Trichonephila clavipes]
MSELKKKRNIMHMVRRKIRNDSAIGEEKKVGGKEMELEAKTRLRRGGWKGRACRYDNRMKYEGTFEKERTHSSEGRSGVVH